MKKKSDNLITLPSAEQVSNTLHVRKNALQTRQGD